MPTKLPLGRIVLVLHLKVSATGRAAPYLSGWRLEVADGVAVQELETLRTEWSPGHDVSPFSFANSVCRLPGRSSARSIGRHLAARQVGLTTVLR